MERLEDRLALAGIEPVSVAHPLTNPPTFGDAASYSGVVSANGRYVVFLSEATNLVPNQEDTSLNGEHFTDIFLFDRVTGNTRLVSGSQGSPTKTAEGESVTAAISADGRYVAFTSRARDLVVGQNESETQGNVGFPDIYLFDRDATSAEERLRLVTHAYDSPTTPANGGVFDRTLALSADGRRIAFASSASNMLAGDVIDPGMTFDVFLYDRGEGQTPESLRLISRSASAPTLAAGLDAREVALSADGQFVAFQSASTDLVANQSDVNGHADVFLYDAVQDRLRLVTGSQGSDSTTANAPSFQAGLLALSAHGRYLAFKSFATDLFAGQIDENNNGDLFLFDRNAEGAGRVRLISHAHDAPTTAATGSSAASELPVINVDLGHDESSGEGLFVAFQSTATNLVAGVTDTGAARDLFVYSVGTGEIQLATHASNSAASPAATLINANVDNGHGRTHLISRDGRFLVYSSPSTDLVENQVDSVLAVTNDVFRFDRVTGKNELLSGAAGSRSQTGDSQSAVSGLSDSGQVVAFASLSSDLVAHDANALGDAFLSVPDLTMEFGGRPFDLMRHNALNRQDEARDAYFRVSLRQGSGGRDITSLEMVRGDGLRWSNSPTDPDRILGVANSLIGAIAGLESVIEVGDGGQFLLFAADATDGTLFGPGQQFTVTARFSDGTTETIVSDPIPAPQLAYLGRLRDRVGRSEQAVVADGQRDGVFQVTFPIGSGIVTSLDLDRGDGNRWNTIPGDSFWVLGAAPSLNDALLNRIDGSLMSDGRLAFSDGGSLILFVPEDRPEAASFFTSGQLFRLKIGYDDGMQQEIHVAISPDNIPPPQPDLTVRISDSPDPIVRFRESVHTVTVRNNGDAPATFVQVRSDRLDQVTVNGSPASVQFAKGDSSPSCDQVGSRVVCTLDTIAPGTEKSVNIAYLFNSAGLIELSAEASATEADLNPADNSDRETTQVVGDIQASITASKGQVEFAEGLTEELTYTLNVDNRNTTPVGGLSIENAVPDEATFVRSLSTSCQLVANVVRCDVGQLEPGQAREYRYVVRSKQAGTIENHGVAVKQGNLVVGGTGSLTVTVVKPKDTDGDALYDRWETNGVDVNSDGIIDLDLPAMGARPDHKDLFVEIDYMACSAGGCEPGATRNHKIDLGAILSVVAAFANAPVNNPDRSTGINLWVQVNEELPESRGIGFSSRSPGPSDDFNDFKLGSNSALAPGVPCGTRPIDGHFGTVADRSSINCANILQARRLTHRYGITGHSTSDLPGRPGIAELPGNDFFLAFETLTDDAVKATAGSKHLPTARRVIQSSLFMHELGHTLGLGHGGDQLSPGADGISGTNDDVAVNDKPNYQSVMNYSLQWPDLDPNRPLDYSRQALADLNENSLDELAGIGGPSGRLAIFRLFFVDTKGNLSTLIVTNPADRKIDWNQDKDFEDRSVRADINVDTIVGTLKGYDDWQNLVYDFRESADFADSDRVSSGDDTVTMEEFAARAESVDFDEDGVSNARDNCITVANADQADADQDGVGDLCEGPNKLWQNPRHPLDTNADTFISAIDALLTINELNSPEVAGEGGLLPDPPSTGVTFFFDANGDDFVSAIDPLQVINFLNEPAGASGESQKTTAWPVAARQLAELFVPREGNRPLAARRVENGVTRTNAGEHVNRTTRQLPATSLPLASAASSRLPRRAVRSHRVRVDRVFESGESWLP